ncbi:hypothetical protein Tco_1050183 [Tanacetum coccineum]
MDLTTAMKNRFMELNELMELRDEAYENTRIYKERTKKWHDSRLRGDKNFKIRDKVSPYGVFQFMDTAYWSHDLAGKEIDEVVIMKYLVKIRKKARILELKRRHLKKLTRTDEHPIRRIHQGRYGVSVPALHKRP